MLSVGGDKLLALDIRSKSYAAASGSIEVLRDVAFTLRRGEFIGLMGPSGAGKSTLLRIVAGLDRDYDGAVALEAARTGMVFQEPRLLPWRNVEQNIRLAAPDISEKELTALLADLSLDAHRAHLPGQLSLGLARRVALARALAIKPDLMLLDEPFVSLDAALAKSLRTDLARTIASRGVTAVLTTHDSTEAVELACRVIVLGGKPATIRADITVASDEPVDAQARIDEYLR